jgi:hypothetical protein
MPYTPAQRRLFHEVEENSDAARRHGISREEGGKLADEADKLAREGKEKSKSFIDLEPVFGRSQGR